jgi:hypothetical protein
LLLEIPDGSSHETRTKPPFVPDRLRFVKKSEATFTATSKSLWTIIEDLHMFVKYGLFLSIGGNIFEEKR